MSALKLLKTGIAVFSENRLTQAAAALSYYLTMTFFPLMIVIYSILDNNYESIVYLSQLAGGLLSKDVLEFVLDFFQYISKDSNKAMLPLGLMLLISYASAALRTLYGCIAAMQGGAEHRGIKFYFVSLVYSMALLAVMYFALLAVLLGENAMLRISRFLPGLGTLINLLGLRYVLLALVLFAVLCGIYHAPKRISDSYSVLPGSCFASISIMLISPVFSFVVGSSVKYSVVYGSISSLILLMLWLYMCCLVIHCGALLNVVLNKAKTGEDN